MQLRQVLGAEVGEAAEVLVDAFATDPFLRWMGGDDDATWQTFGQAWFELVLGRCVDRGHTYRSDPTGLVIAWLPPGETLLTPDDVERARGIIAGHGGEVRADAAVATVTRTRDHFPTAPHWTLQYIGLASAVRGRGRGTAAAAPTLERIDADGVPAALVSSNVRNVPFYERLGFEVMAEATTPDGAATLRPMVRTGPSIRPSAHSQA